LGAFFVDFFSGEMSPEVIPVAAILNDRQKTRIVAGFGVSFVDVREKEKTRIYESIIKTVLKQTDYFYFEF
jgi:hypothetical protein